ncbi:hypothetical protein O166_01865 [Pseudogulbenkiania ferrooxidans EGD-HP2]|uniref:Transposase n=1 Tax=Pseudogulbenkiania ferrooxidans EGD-HP2 TaxID=1388764 RepID=A0ABN0N3Q6_9NEIS|nr:hypothetical protein O166_01865 [Pseudogulbenkiania ferrooxidans EGD-HP2]
MDFLHLRAGCCVKSLQYFHEIARKGAEWRRAQPAGPRKAGFAAMLSFLLIGMRT